MKNIKLIFFNPGYGKVENISHLEINNPNGKNILTIRVLNDGTTSCMISSYANNSNSEMSWFNSLDELLECAIKGKKVNDIV